MRRCGFVFAIGFSLAANVALAAEEGFYGGLGAGLNSPAVAPVIVSGTRTAWTRLSPAGPDEIAGATLLYGGYRFQKLPLLGVEAAISSTADSGRVGLRLDPSVLGGRVNDAQARNWNVDVFTNLVVNPSLAVYGRMGYGYNDAARDAASGVVSNFAIADSVMRKYRDGFNYGMGLRYDLNRTLGLRLEWSRFARFGSDALTSNPQPDSDQLSIGVHYRF
jgi:opacity protein-like surface antigen